MTTIANGNYPSGAALVLGLKLKDGVTGYKASIVTAEGKGKVEYLTDNWTTAQKLSDILEKAGVEAGNDGKYSPGVPPANTTFKGWAEVKSNGSIANIDSNTYDSDSKKYPSGTSFVAVYEASFQINLGTAKNSFPLPLETKKVDMIAPNTGVTLKDMFKAAGKDTVADAAKDKAPDGKDLAMGWKVTLPDGTEYVVSSKQINNGTGKAAETFPPGTKIEPNWVTNAEAATGGSDRTLTNLNTSGFTSLYFICS